MKGLSPIGIFDIPVCDYLYTKNITLFEKGFYIQAFQMSFHDVLYFISQFLTFDIYISCLKISNPPFWIYNIIE